MASVYAGVTSEATDTEPCDVESLDLLDAAVRYPYGDMSTREHAAHIPALRELRDVIIPTWRAGEHADLYAQHYDTIEAVLTLFESMVLGRFRGERGAQRGSCNTAFPGFLKLLSDTRSWVRAH